MRERFNQQSSLDATPISEVKIDSKTRHELAPLLAALQYIFVTPELNEKVFTILESKILEGKKQTGRLGMSLWEILVLGCVRLNLNTNYDFLQDQANNHFMLRGILGVRTGEVFSDGHYYELSTLKENVRLLDEATLQKISNEVVKAAHELKKKEEGLKGVVSLRIKSDSFPVASNVHFPTDMNLLWDSIRKSLEVLLSLLEVCEIKGWRKIAYTKDQLKKYYRKTSEIHRKKGGNYKSRLEVSAKVYIEKSDKLSAKIKAAMEEFEKVGETNLKVFLLLPELKRFVRMLDKHSDLLRRRVIEEEKIPHQEKVFSIFEEHVEWLTKGKLHGGVVIGHNVLVSTDQYHFIVDHKVAEKEVDKKMAIPLGERLAKSFSEGYCLESLSLDRGFYSDLGKKALQGIFGKVILPKPGKKSVSIEQEESAEDYVKLRKKHSAVESNINELRHSGVDRVPDKGLVGFKKYVALGVLAYNLRRLGQLVMAQQKIKTLLKSGKPKPIAA